MSDQYRCSHTAEILGWGHPWRFERPYAHACCQVPGHCPSTDNPPPTGLWEIRTRDSLHLVDLGTENWGWLRTPGRRPDGTVTRTYRDEEWTGVHRVAALKDGLHDRLPEIGEHLIVWTTHGEMGWLGTSYVVSIEEVVDE